MDSKNVFRRYRKRLVAEGVVKSLILGLLVGFTANIVAAVVSFFFDFNGVWLSIGLLIGGTLISAPIIYAAKFRPTAKQIAARADRLGLEERVLTMLELEKDDSYIAMRQREDAKEALAATNKKLKVSVFTSTFMKPGLIAALSVAFVLSVSATTLSGLIGLTQEKEPSVPQYTIKYGVKDPIPPDEEKAGVKTLAAKKTTEEPPEDEKAAAQGHIFGSITQTVEEGKTTTTVVAVAAEKWVFVGWSDGYAEEDRADIAENGDKEILAIFAEKEVDADETEIKDGPPLSGNSSGGGTGGGGGGGTGGEYVEPNDQVIDGETGYKEVYEEYYQKAMEILANGDIPPSLQKIIEAYLNTLK